MLLFLKGLIIGLAKIIPGVSGALLAINFNIYERAIDAVTNYFNNWKNNLKFLSLLGLGIIISITLGSKLILYLFLNYKFVTLMFFIGLIIGGTYKFSKEINYNYNYKTSLFIIIPFVLLLIISLSNINNKYILKNNFGDNIIFFIGGIIEIFASIVPGISGTSLLMILGIYEHILMIISKIFEIKYVLSHIQLYISYGIGMFISFLGNTYLINYLLKKYKNTTYAIILGLSLASILFLIIITFRSNFTIIEFIIGIMLLIIGLLISFILNK